jgi:hypothetical protein
MLDQSLRQLVTAAPIVTQIEDEHPCMPTPQSGEYLIEELAEPTRARRVGLIVETPNRQDGDAVAITKPKCSGVRVWRIFRMRRRLRITKHGAGLATKNDRSAMSLRRPNLD